MNILILSGIILTLVEIIKKTFGISSKYIPMVSLILMIVLMFASWAYNGYPSVPLEVLLENLVAVLTAMGIYSGTKATLGK